LRAATRGSGMKRYDANFCTLVNFYALPACSLNN